MIPQEGYAQQSLFTCYKELMVATRAQVKSDDASVAAADVQAHVASILGGGAGAHLGDKRRRAAAARA